MLRLSVALAALVSTLFANERAKAQAPFSGLKASEAKKLMTMKPPEAWKVVKDAAYLSDKTRECLQAFLLYRMVRLQEAIGLRDACDDDLARSTLESLDQPLVNFFKLTSQDSQNTISIAWHDSIESMTIPQQQGPVAFYAPGVLLERSDIAISPQDGRTSWVIEYRIKDVSGTARVEVAAGDRLRALELSELQAGIVLKIDGKVVPNQAVVLIKEKSKTIEISSGNETKTCPLPLAQNQPLPVEQYLGSCPGDQTSTPKVPDTADATGGYIGAQFLASGNWAPDAEEDAYAGAAAASVGYGHLFHGGGLGGTIGGLATEAGVAALVGLEAGVKLGVAEIWLRPRYAYLSLKSLKSHGLMLEIPLRFSLGKSGFGLDVSPGLLQLALSEEQRQSSSKTLLTIGAGLSWRSL